MAFIRNLTVALLAAQVVAFATNVDTSHALCGAPEPSEEQKQVARELARAEQVAKDSEDAGEAAPLVISTVIHVVSGSDRIEDGNVPVCFMTFLRKRTLISCRTKQFTTKCAC
jgi:hypothetical protein